MSADSPSPRAGAARGGQALAARERVIVALDLPSAQRALELAAAVQPHVGCFKVGLELFIAEGPALVRSLAERRPVFLDLKLHDIPATVGRAAAAAAQLGARYLTVHPSGGEQLDAVARAVEAAPELRVLLVTVLTSERAGEGTTELVVSRARRAAALGCGGVICSGHEAAAVRSAVGGALEIITPGVRPAGAPVGDQARVMTPAEAIGAGADRLVIGRPIRDADDPAHAAAAIVEELDA